MMPMTIAQEPITQISAKAPAPGMTSRIAPKKPYCADDLEHAAHQRPRSDEHQQRESGEARHCEGEYAGGNAQQANRREPPARGRAALAADRRQDREYPVDERIGPIEEDERQDGDARPGEGQHAEQNGEEAAQKQQPPVSRKAVEQNSSGAEVPCSRSSRHVTLQ